MMYGSSDINNTPQNNISKVWLGNMVVFGVAIVVIDANSAVLSIP